MYFDTCMTLFYIAMYTYDSGKQTSEEEDGMETLNEALKIIYVCSVYSTSNVSRHRGHI